jgi:type IV secretory pathway component VirB8
VDNSTGVVDVVNSVKDGDTNYEESVNKYFTQCQTALKSFQ